MPTRCFRVYVVSPCCAAVLAPIFQMWITSLAYASVMISRAFRVRLTTDTGNRNVRFQVPSLKHHSDFGVSAECSDSKRRKKCQLKMWTHLLSVLAKLGWR